MNKYPVTIFWSDEDGCYVAVAPDLKGCSAVGDTPEEALREINTAVQLWLETAKAENRVVPEPSRVAA